MRIARLDLLRYGRFTDRSIALPRAKRDLHILFGPNEAGKTTSLAAIEDLLFGIPNQTPYGFLHNYDAIRLGAMLEDDDGEFMFQRRKGNRNTVLGSDGSPLPGGEALLAPYLHGADRTFFGRMFNLSHSRLAEGGRAILQAEGDLGQMLFAAGTGLEDLRQRQDRLEEEADGLWAPHKAKHRLYYHARDRFDAAEAERRQHSLSVNAWKERRRDERRSRQTLQDCRRDAEANAAELKKLARIRRVHRTVREWCELDRNRAELAEMVALPENAGQILTRAEQQEREAEAQKAALKPQLDEARQALDALEVDEALVSRADDIGRLDERRIELQAGWTDLPKRKHEYQLELETLARLAGELGWQFEDPATLIDRVPSQVGVATVRQLLQRQGGLHADLRNARTSRKEAEAEQKDQALRRDAVGEARDTTGLAAVLDSVRELGDVAGRIRVASGTMDALSKEIARKRELLRPPLSEDIDIEALAVPSRNAVDTSRDRVKDLANRRVEHRRHLADAGHDLERDRKTFERRMQEEGVVPPGAVGEAREARDALWQRVKARYVTQTAAPEPAEQPDADGPEHLPAAFERAVEQADDAADRRFDKAEAAGELAAIETRISEQELRVAQLEEKGAALQAEDSQLDEAWRSLWTDLPLEPLDPDAMAVWLDLRDSIVQLHAKRREAELELSQATQQEHEAKAQLRAALQQCGEEDATADADTLQAMIRRAESFRQKEEAKAERIAELDEELRKAKSGVSRAKRLLAEAQEAWNSWKEDWASALTALGLPGDSAVEAAAAQINVIDDMREHATAARNLRDKRIATIERDIEAYTRDVADLVGELAPDLADQTAASAVCELVLRRDEALELQRQRQDREAAADKLQKQLADLDHRRKAGWASVRVLLEQAGVKEVDALRAAIVQSDRSRTVQEQWAAASETLERDGDGLGIEHLVEECRDINIDEVTAKEETARADAKLIGERLEAAVATWTEANAEWEAIGGGDAAARAAADREEALAAMRNAAARYVQTRAAATMLRWTIERYRQEKQGPLLQRAGELFQVLTRNSFARLQVQFGSDDSMQLAGVRPDGEVVAAPGLSTGTEDQLFLALRTSAVEDYLASAGSLPFVADDLFINFDEERAAAGFEVLGQLSERTQVLFYTHHRHLVDLAQDALGEHVHLVQLADPA